MESSGVAAAETPLTRALARAARTGAARVEQVLRPEGFSLDQWLVVETLATEGGLAMAQLATRTMATGPTLTRVVDRLVTTATVYREVAADDRRKVLVYLSPRGYATFRRIAPRVREAEQELLSRLSAPESVLEALGHLAGPG